MPSSLKHSLLILCCLLVLAIGWRWLMHAGYLDAGLLAGYGTQLQQFGETGWGVLAFCLLYVVLLAVIFPLTLLVVMTGLLFSTEWALFIAVLGSMSSSAVGYGLGHWAGRTTIEKHGGQLVRRTEQVMQHHSLKSMVMINLLPVAPFTLTNMLAGALKLDFCRYMLGSAIGLIPGLIVVIVLGGQLKKLLTLENTVDAAMVMVACMLLIAVSVGVLKWLDKKWRG